MHGVRSLHFSGFGPDELLYLVLYPLDVRNIHVVGGGAHIFMLLVGEDVDTNQVHLQRKRFEQSQSEHTFSSTDFKQHPATPPPKKK